MTGLCLIRIHQLLWNEPGENSNVRCCTLAICGNVFFTSPLQGRSAENPTATYSNYTLLSAASSGCLGASESLVPPTDSLSLSLPHLQASRILTSATVAIQLYYLNLSDIFVLSFSKWKFWRLGPQAVGSRAVAPGGNDQDWPVWFVKCFCPFALKGQCKSLQINRKQP